MYSTWWAFPLTLPLLVLPSQPPTLPHLVHHVSQLAQLVHAPACLRVARVPREGGGSGSGNAQFVNAYACLPQQHLLHVGFPPCQRHRCDVRARIMSTTANAVNG